MKKGNILTGVDGELDLSEKAENRVPAPARAMAALVPISMIWFILEDLLGGGPLTELEQLVQGTWLDTPLLVLPCKNFPAALKTVPLTVSEKVLESTLQQPNKTRELNTKMVSFIFAV